MSDNEDNGDEQPMSAEERQTYNDVIENDTKATAKSPFKKLGLLTKLGRNVKSWNERGFALRGENQTLMYFRNAEDFKKYAADPQRNAAKVAGTISLANAKLFLAVYVEHDFCIEITTDSKAELRHYYMYAKARGELQHWISKLTETGVTFVAPVANIEELRAAHPDGPEPILGMQGFIEKRGEVNTSFKKRFFRIERSPQGQNLIAWYNRYDDIKPNGTQSLRNCTLKDASESGGSNGWLWNIVSPDRTYQLRSSSENEKKLWMKVLSWFVEHPDEPAPTLVSLGEMKLDRGNSSRRNGSNGALSPRGPNGNTAGTGAAAVAGGAAAGSTRTGDARGSAASSHGIGGLGNSDDAAAIAAIQAEQKKQREEKEAKASLEKQRKDARALVEAGADFVKHGRSGKPHSKAVYLIGYKLYWDDAGKRKMPKDKCLDLDVVTSVTKGKTTEVLKRDTAQGVADKVCFSLLADDRTLDLEAPSEAVCDQWADALNVLVSEAKATRNS